MRNLSSTSGSTSNSIRWAFNFRAWNPTEQEYMLATQCIQQEEKSNIEKYVFKKDVKASLAGQLIVRKFLHSVSHIPYSDIRTQRDSQNRPFFPNTSNIDFNVSHEGLYTVLAGEVGVKQTIGVDIMHIKRRTGHKMNEFFHLMSRTFAPEEWETINSSLIDQTRIAMFYRHWCLKESYVKAIGVGITHDLRRIRFHIKTKQLSQTTACVDTALYVDGIHQPDWRFEEWMLDEEHIVAVALPCNNSNPTPFKILDYTEVSKGMTPISPPDPEAAHKFISKPESP